MGFTDRDGHHTFRDPGLVAYLEASDILEHAQAIAIHEYATHAYSSFKKLFEEPVLDEERHFDRYDAEFSD